MPLKIIGAGFGRTGTESMRMALNLLGLGPCHHMHEVTSNPEQLKLWRAKAAGEDIPWSVLFDGYRSTVDWPSAYYWRELIDVYPDAKVLLTTRTAESWYKSINKTIFQVLRKNDDKGMIGDVLIRRGTFDERIEEEDHVLDVFRRHEAEVKATVPADRLLVYPVGSGWEPLCEFLGVPIPDQDYPRSNSADDFLRNVKERDVAAP